MKRFFSFLFFLLLLALTVATVQVWSDHRQGAYYGWRRSVLDLLNGDSGRRRPEKYTVADALLVNPKDVNVLAAMSRQRIALARAVVPSVVSITTTTLEAPSLKNDPFYLFRHGLRRGGLRTEKQLGSGAIVSKEGHIVTNDHVVEGMAAIEVELSDGRRMPARLVGTDSYSDVAVLKIDAAGLQPLPFADSDLVEVGETVMAVGNPYGLEESVTQGIVSAKGRRGGEDHFDLFQTDAAVNPGNSGGPLINVRGELIGLNEAILSESGGWQGVSFAIPAVTVRRAMDDILKLGRVMHGYLGIHERTADPEAVHDESAAGAKGVVVDSIVAGSPAEKAAIKPGDVIQKFNQKPIQNFDDLRRSVGEVDVDVAVPVEVLRNGKTLSVTARIAERPPPEAELAKLPHYPDETPLVPRGGGTIPSGDASALGLVRMQDITPAEASKFSLPEATRGVMVMAVGADSPAADKLEVGDVIEQINHQSVGMMSEIRDHLGQLPEGHPVILSIIREHKRLSVEIDPR